MRSLVIESIIQNYAKGLTESGLSYIDFTRNKDAPVEARSTLKPEKYEYDGDIPLNEFIDIIHKLTDKELLFVLDQQACQNYR